jgi:hypothetical protein
MYIGSLADDEKQVAVRFTAFSRTVGPQYVNDFVKLDVAPTFFGENVGFVICY